MFRFPSPYTSLSTRARRRSGTVAAFPSLWDRPSTASRSVRPSALRLVTPSETASAPVRRAA